MLRPFLRLAVLLAFGVCLLLAVRDPHPYPRNIKCPTPPTSTVQGPGSEVLYELVKNIGCRLGSGSKVDIDKAMLDPSIKGREAIAVCVLRENFSDLSGGKEQITLNDLAVYQKGVVRSHLADKIDQRFMQLENFLSRVNRQLYPLGAKADSLVKMRLVQQVARGNCYLLSGLGSLAALDPEEIRACITDNGIDTKRGIRTYTVVFPREPKIKYVVDDFTDATLVYAELDEESGTWAAVMTRAYGKFMKRHGHIRLVQRLWNNLDKKVLPEDMTDCGSMDNEGLRMVMDQRTHEVRRVLWGFDDAQIAKVVDEIIDGTLRSNASPSTKALLKAIIVPQVKRGIDSMCQTRDPALVHELLTQSITQAKLPGTVVKHGGAHEVSIIGYQPGTKTADGKHESKFGFVVVRDQAGLYEDEEKFVKSGRWWREPGMDGKTICLTTEDFTATYCGFHVVVEKR